MTITQAMAVRPHSDFAWKSGFERTATGLLRFESVLGYCFSLLLLRHKNGVEQLVRAGHLVLRLPDRQITSVGTAPRVVRRRSLY